VYIKVLLLILIVFFNSNSTISIAQDVTPFETKTYLEYINSEKGLIPIDFSKINECESQLYSENGIVTYYADYFHGRKTSSGEIYDKYQYTAAHLTLPFGSIVRVTDINNANSILVRVNDRGPFVSGRIIDLSQKAAEKLGIGGTTLVEIATLIVDNYNLPVNEDYFFCFSLDYNPMCLSQSYFKILETTKTFDEAVDLVRSYSATFKSKDYFLCVEANTYNKRSTEEDSYIYNICLIDRKLIEFLK